VFLNHLAFAMPALGASFRQDELRSTTLLVLRARFEGGVIDESLHRPCSTRGSAWSRVRIVLAGPICTNGLGVTPGQIVVTSFGTTARGLTLASDWLELVWQSAEPTTAVATLSARSLMRARTLASALEGDDRVVAVGALSELLGDLQALGLPFATPSDDAKAGRFARTLWHRAMDLENQPMAVDLADALGVSERHALRQTSHFLRQFHLSASSWRELMQCLRLEMGSFFMSNPAARTEDVSRYLGFRSPTGFCHAFHDAGLPSPQAIHRDLRVA
jgi:AraC-like DNA-binding protein